MKLKPIEPGCNAIIINMKQNIHLNGLVVKVVSYSDISHSFHGAPTWKVRGHFQAVSTFGSSILNEGYIFEKNLLRIDGDDFSEEGSPYVVKDKELDRVTFDTTYVGSKIF